MKTTYEIPYSSNPNEKAEDDMTSAQAVNQILSTIYDGLHHRGLFFEDGYSVDEGQMESNSISLKLFDLKYQYLLNFKVLKSVTPTQILVEVEEMFHRPDKLPEPELIQIRKTYEILKDSFLFSKNIKLHSETSQLEINGEGNCGSTTAARTYPVVRFTDIRLCDPVFWSQSRDE